MSITFIFVLLAPITYGLVNIIDEYYCSKKIKNPFSYTAVVGIVHLILGLLMASFLNWENFTPSMLLLPGILGFFYAIQLLIYYYSLYNEDVSEIVGIDYSYPIIVAILSFFILNENLGILGYTALILIILGVFNLEKRMCKMCLNMNVWVLIGMPIITGIYEFIIKISTINIPEFNAVAINSIVAGTIVMSTIFLKKVRVGLSTEIKNIGYAFANESLTILAILFIFLAMKYYPATIVSSIGTLEVLFVLIIEQFVLVKIGGITRDKILMPKLSGIILIISGVVLMTIVGII